MEMQTNSCPCCGGFLLRHIRQGGVYWFCTSCSQEVPLLKMPLLQKIAVNKPLASVKPSQPIQPVN